MGDSIKTRHLKVAKGNVLTSAAKNIMFSFRLCLALCVVLPWSNNTAVTEIPNR